MHEMFISYGSGDLELAERICRQLENAGIKCWMAPRDIAAGADHADAIPRAIIQCSCFLLILTENAQTSEWVRREIACAINHHKTIIPFCPEQIQLTESMYYLLEGTQWVDLRDGWTEAIDRILQVAAQNGKPRPIEKRVMCCPKCRSINVVQRSVWPMGKQQLKQWLRPLAGGTLAFLWLLEKSAEDVSADDIFILFPLIFPFVILMALTVIARQRTEAKKLKKKGQEHLKMLCMSCSHTFDVTIPIGSIDYKKIQTLDIKDNKKWFRSAARLKDRLIGIFKQ